VLPPSRLFKCVVRPDKNIALFYKPKENISLRAFVLSKNDLLKVINNARDKKSLVDPCVNGYPLQSNPALKSGDIATYKLGFFTIECTHPTIRRMLRFLKPYECS